MSSYFNLTDFLQPLSLHKISNEEGYKDGQIGRHISVYEESLPDIADADFILIGCGEERGNRKEVILHGGPDAIRHEFYNLYYWHTDIKLADLGNIMRGATLADTYAALKTVIKELSSLGKTIIILGGSHDLSLPQYYAYAALEQQVQIACIDARINLEMQAPQPSAHFLMELLTSEPNFVQHYNHIGFQSYFVHPTMLETLDKLRFDCFRVGKVKENLEEMEPVIRNCHMLSFDIEAIAHAFAPAHSVSPNGFDGEQACTLMRYAGMSRHMSSIGIYGYSLQDDQNNLTAKQISNMLWYVMDGRSRGKAEAELEERESFNEYHIAFAEIGTVFLQSKKTGRWWMELPDKKFIACSYKDYMLASSNEIPERWLRAQERS